MRSLHHTRPTPLPTFLFGSPYYPEHWEAAIREKDPALFSAAGWNTIRMAEFAWNLMEPEEGRFDFSLFDETIERFAAVGIRTILCTPTEAPPRWLTHRYPEVLSIDADGKPLSHGSRQHASVHSRAYRAHSRRITAAMAAHFADNPHVIGWQTDNEFHCHFSEDHSPDALAGFIEFLRTKYPTISALNRAWGTAFWAQTYDSFGQIVTPRPNRPVNLNPAHMLDYHRYLSHAVTLFQREQVNILRSANPSWWITHNGVFKHIDYHGDFTRDLDFLSYDSYPSFDPNPETRPFSHAFNIDYVRGLGGNMLIMEQQSGPGGQGGFLQDTPAPGDMRLMAWVNVARGADGILLFRERTCRFGAEEYWCGVIDHDNVPRRRYREAAQLGEELGRIGPRLLGTHVEVGIGIAAGDFDSLVGHEPITLGLPGPKQSAETLHHHLNQAGYAVGCVHPDEPLDGLKLYIVPHLTLLNPDWIPAWEAWVRAGGILVIGARSGTKDKNGNVVATTPPGALRPLVGLTVEEYGRQNRPDLRPLPLSFSKEGPWVQSQHWYEELGLDADTEALALWRGAHLDGRPAAALRQIGKGTVVYLGTYFTPDVTSALLEALAARNLLLPPSRAVPGVQQRVRTNGSDRFRFLVNHNPHACVVPLPAPGHDLIGDRAVDNQIELPANDLAIVLETPHSR